VTGVDTVRPCIFVGRRGGMTAGDIRNGGAKGDGRKIRLLIVISAKPDELNDLGAHEHPSHTAIAISPASASDIRYAVIGFSFGMKCAA
jgi:hypothetical protein